MISKAWILLSLFLVGSFGSIPPSSKGVVEDVTDCGSETERFQLRVDTCSSVPCELHPDVPYSMDIDFIASASHVRVSMRLTVIQADGTETIVLESLVGGGTIEEGQFYTLTYVLTPNAVLRGELFDIRLEIFEAIANHKEVCISAPFTIV